MDLAGVVDIAGPGATGWARGDRVMAAVSPWEPGGGAQAEYVVVSADALARVPERISLRAAATLPMNALTVLAALGELALRPGQTLGVTGAAGAVGGYAIQLGRSEGLRVVADASPADEDLVSELGAHMVVPRGPGVAGRMRQVLPAGVDALLDAAVMGPQVLAAVRDGGQVIAVRPFSGETERGISVSLVLVFRHLHEGGKLARLAELAAKGVLSLRVADVLPAARAAEAHRRFEAHGVRGQSCWHSDPVEYVYRKPTGSPADRGAAPPRYRLEQGPAGMIIERDVPVPVRGGVTVYADVFRPADERPAPR